MRRICAVMKDEHKAVVTTKTQLGVDNEWTIRRRRTSFNVMPRYCLLTIYASGVEVARCAAI